MDDLNNKVLALEDQSDEMGGDIYHFKRQMASLTLSKKVLTGRLLRAETVIERQRKDISDLRMRSMRDNIIIKSKGEAYK